MHWSALADKQNIEHIPSFPDWRTNYFACKTHLTHCVQHPPSSSNSVTSHLVLCNQVTREIIRCIHSLTPPSSLSNLTSHTHTHSLSLLYITCVDSSSPSIVLYCPSFSNTSQLYPTLSQVLQVAPSTYAVVVVDTHSFFAPRDGLQWESFEGRKEYLWHSEGVVVMEYLYKWKQEQKCMSRENIFDVRLLDQCVCAIVTNKTPRYSASWVRALQDSIQVFFVLFYTIRLYLPAPDRYLWLAQN